MDTTLEPKRFKKNLPPIQRHALYYHDPYKCSFLMTYDLKKQQEDKQKNLM